MKQEKNLADRRVKRTKSALRENFLILLEKTPVNKISVSELCKRCDINRSTFYTYYSSPMDLLEEMVRDIFFGDLEDGDADADEDRIYKVCSRIYENKAFCRELFGPHGDVSYLSRMFTAAHDKKISDLQKEYPDADMSRLEYLFTFIRMGSTGVLVHWIQNNFAESPEKVADLINEFGASTMQNLRMTAP